MTTTAIADPAQLHARLVAWSNTNNTDGFIPTRIAFMLSNRDTMHRLERKGLCEPTFEPACGWQIRMLAPVARE